MGNDNQKQIDRQGRTAFYQYDPKLGFWGIPDISGDVFFEMGTDQSGKTHGVTVNISHNSHGVRDDEYDGSKGCIVCYGGSHTWGAGVEKKDRYTDILNRELDTRVVNCGVGSFGLDQLYMLILDRAETYSPSVIVIEQYPWALHRVLNPTVHGYVRPHYVLDSRGELELRKIPGLTRFKAARKVMESFISFKKELVESKAGIDLREGYDPASDPIFLYWKMSYYDYMYNLLDKILAGLKNYCDRKDIRLMFTVGAIQQEFGPASGSDLVDYALPRKRFEALLDKNSIEYVDMVAPLLAAHSQDEPAIYPDTHINAKGHAVCAGQIKNRLEKLGWA